MKKIMILSTLSRGNFFNLFGKLLNKRKPIDVKLVKVKHPTEQRTLQIDALQNIVAPMCQQKKNTSHTTWAHVKKVLEDDANMSFEDAMDFARYICSKITKHKLIPKNIAKVVSKHNPHFPCGRYTDWPDDDKHKKICEQIATIILKK